MNKESYLLFADLILITHVLFVAFVVFGLFSIFVGRVLTWQWVRNKWFRIIHLAGIGVVVAQSWIGVICPLTEWEMALRESAGEATYSGAFIAHWLHKILYFRAPEWVFTVSYTLFGLLVLASWYVIPPQLNGSKSHRHDSSTIS